MTKKLFHLTWIVLLAWAARSGRAGEVIDRIVAIVNGTVILQSDWDEAVCYEAFVAGRPLDQLTAADYKATLDRLIDQELLREQMQSSDFQHAGAEEVQKRIQEIHQLYPDAKTPQQWQAALARHGLMEKELETRVARQIDLLRLVEVRLRPGIQIDARSIESYYREKVVPELEASGAQQVTLADVTPKIKELRTQQKMNELLTAWLQSLRSESDIRTAAATPPASLDHAQ